MAYNDYGAFVYKNKKRQRDYEDAEFMSSDIGLEELPSSHRIFAKLINDMQNEDETQELEFRNGLWHAVLGDNNVKVGAYKTGLWACEILYIDPESGEVDTLDGDEIIRTAIGDKALAYDPDWDYDSPIHEEYERQQYGPYDYHIDFHGAHINFKSTGCIPGKPTLPHYEVHMTDVDGSQWDAYYDSLYGAGHTDCDYNEDYFDILDDDKVHLKIKNFWYGDGGYRDDVLYDGSIIWDNDMNIKWYSAHAHSFLNEDGVDHDVLLGHISSSYNNSVIDPEDYAAILNEGIRLAHEGYDAVHVSSLLTAHDVPQTSSGKAKQTDKGVFILRDYGFTDVIDHINDNIDDETIKKHNQYIKDRINNDHEYMLRQLNKKEL